MRPGDADGVTLRRALPVSMSGSEALAHAGRALLMAGGEATKNFEWIVVIGGFLAFFAAFGIGESRFNFQFSFVTTRARK